MYLKCDMCCCGIREIGNLQDTASPEAAMKDFMNEIAPHPSYCTGRIESRDKFRYAIFSATQRSRYGTNFASYITEHKLGELIETGYNKNPNSRRMLKIWVWTLDHVALKKWKDEHMQKPKAKTRKQVAADGSLNA